MSVREWTKCFRIDKGVKQGDPISPGLYPAVLETAMINILWQDRGDLINEQRLNNVRYAGDVILLSTMSMSCKVSHRSVAKLGVTTDFSRTNVTLNKLVTKAGNLNVGNTQLEHVRKYIYRGQLINMKPEIYCHNKLSWQTYWRNCSAFRSNVPIHLMKTVFG